MRYLLVGNGPSANVRDKARHAEVVIQINACKYADCIPTSKATSVFVANTGAEISEAIIASLLEKRHLLPNIRLILAKNPAFYRLKGWAVTLRRSWAAPCYRLTRGWQELPWPVETVSLSSTLGLECMLRRRRMGLDLMPSTGMIAYYSLLRRLKRGDSLDLAGFTFEGWSGHPWEIESHFVRGVYPPGYRDDPSYEKRPSC